MKRDGPRRIVITGASRGLGLEFTRQWLQSGADVCALVRNPAKVRGLDSLREEFADRLAIVPCDVADDKSVRNACRVVAKGCRRIDVLVNNAGVTGRTSGGLRRLDLEDMSYTFNVNAQGPLRICKGLLPLLRRGRDPRIILVTSKMGSIGDNTSGDWYAYRMSKAALNMACANLALELQPKKVIVSVVHPGWVRTDMGGSGAPLGTEESVRGMIEQIDKLTLEDTGSFVDYAGARIPW